MFQFPAFPSYPYVFRIRYLVSMLENRRSQSSFAIRRSRIKRPKTDKPQATHPIFQASKVGFPIRISTDQSIFAAPRGFSQRITSFIGCACQGIHQMPLRHLIVLIANAHARCADLGRKDQLLEICPMARLGYQSCWRPLEHGRRRPIKRARTNLLFTMCTKQADSAMRRLRTYLLAQMMGARRKRRPRLCLYDWPCVWWSVSGSNR